MERTDAHLPTETTSAPYPAEQATRNRAVSRLVALPFSEKEVTHAAQSALEEIGGQVSIGFLFATTDYLPHLDDLLELIQVHAHVPLLITSSGSGVIGTDRDSERSGGFSLLLLHLPNTAIHPVEISPDYGAESPGDWYRYTGLPPKKVDFWISLVDPFGFPVERWLESWSQAYPLSPTMGGLSASSSIPPGSDEIFIAHNQKVLPPGHALLLAFQSGVTLHSIVSQGCRPIGEPYTITRADGNMILALGGRPAYTVLAEAFESLSAVDKVKAQGNLFAGLASTEYLEEFKQGDFLIRTILGADAQSGAIAVGAYPRVGQTLQWQLRDPHSAGSDLERHLYAAHSRPPLASLIFSCASRGKELFGASNHDAHAIATILGPSASAGLFCNGEIGPAGSKTFVHGNSISIALFV